MKTFGETMNQCMAERGMNQKAVCQLSGISSAYISQLRSGKIADPTFLKACAIVAALGMALIMALRGCQKVVAELPKVAFFAAA